MLSYYLVRSIIVVFVVTMSSLGIVERAEISSWFNSRFIRVLIKRTFATCCSVNAVPVYLMNPILALWCVLYLSYNNQVLFFSLEGGNDGIVTVFHGWYCSGGVDGLADEKMWIADFAIVDVFEFCCVIYSRGELFGMMNDSIVIGDDFHG